MIDVQVAASDSRKSKGRSFAGTLVAWVEGKALWALGDSNKNTTRPIWALFFVHTGEAGAFIANLQMGHAVETEGRRPSTWEFLRSAGYEYALQRYPEGVAVNVYLPELFALTPGLLDAKYVRFVILPPAAWLEEATSAEELELQEAHVRKSVPLPEDTDITYPCKLAGIFLHRLNARTRAPLIADARFAAQILVAALDQGIATMACESASSWSPPWGQGKHGYVEHSIEAAKLCQGVAVNTTHDALESFLAEQVAVFDKTRETPKTLPKTLKIAPVSVLRKQRRAQ